MSSGHVDVRQGWDGWKTKPYQCHPHASSRSAQIAEAACLRPTDVVILTFPKTGTTFLQQICEQLRTGGDMSFSEITERQPWLDFAYDAGQEIDAEQVAEPRLFKSHLLLSAINPGAKYLTLVRNPRDVLKSLFAFLKAKNRPITADCEDANEWALRGRFNEVFGINIWDYYVDLWEARQEPNVLVLVYETLMRNRKAHLPKIAEFLGAPMDGSRLETVMHMSSKEFMLEHPESFDDSFLSRRLQEFGRSAKPIEPAPKVTLGQHVELTVETSAWLEQKWTELVAPRTGHASYEAMSAAIVAELDVSHAD